MSNSPRSAVLLLLAGIDALGPGMFLDSSFREPEMHFFFLKVKLRTTLLSTLHLLSLKVMMLPVST